MRGKWQTETEQSSDNTGKKKFFRKYRMILAFLILIISIPAILYLTHKWDSKRTIIGINILQSNFIPDSEVLKLIPDTLFKREKSTIKLREIEAAIYKHPFVEKVILSYGLHDRIDVELGTRSPIAVLIDNYGKMFLVDSESVVLPYKFFDRFPDLYIIRNAYFGDTLQQSVLKSAISILLKLRNNEYRILPHELNEIIFKRESKTFELSILPDNLNVKIGDMTDIDVKLLNLDIFLEHYFYGKINQKLAYIDVRWTKQVIIKEKMN